MKVMGVKLSMTTAHRAQADGQSERQNLILEDALQCMIAGPTKMTPFEIDTYFAKNFSERRQKIISEAKKKLLAAQERMKQHYDTKRRDVQLQADE
ncbi:hypothetical protein PINS_up013606 [Pythium insidiosum]|nr:hypothetical protein PINS_up013606 [Pythium insidiosum]